MDRLTSEHRSRLMSRVGGKDTAPEMVVRRLLHSLGYRYRLHVRNMPSRPDLVFPARKKVILVHGCFWHRHEGCRKATTPKSNEGFWRAKFQRNIERDADNSRALSELGWQVCVVWECETKNVADLREKLVGFL